MRPFGRAEELRESGPHVSANVRKVRAYDELGRLW